MISYACGASGTALGHGHAAVQDKVMALLSSAWLLAGPAVEGLAHFCSSVRSLTTDFGVEKGICDFRNALPAFAGHMGLECPGWVAKQAWTFPNAIQIPGWNHIFSNLVKDTMASLAVWPSILERLRGICFFFRNADYRYSWQRQLQAKNIQGIDIGVLDHFTASFAKWRWETLHLVLTKVCQLAPLRVHFDASLYRNTKDAAGLKTVEESFNDPQFWAWTRVMQSVVQLVEQARLWGCLCSCHEAELLQGKAIDCPRKSRRLAEAGPYIDAWCLKLQAKAAGITLADCCGFQEVMRDAQYSCHKIVGLAKLKLAWLSEIPWAFAQAGKPHAAQMCLKQWQSASAEQHHRASCSFFSDFMEDIQACSEGRSTSPQFQASQSKHRSTPYPTRSTL